MAPRTVATPERVEINLKDKVIMQAIGQDRKLADEMLQLIGNEEKFKPVIAKIYHKNSMTTSKHYVTLVIELKTGTDRKKWAASIRNFVQQELSRRNIARISA